MSKAKIYEEKMRWVLNQKKTRNRLLQWASYATKAAAVGFTSEVVLLTWYDNVKKVPRLDQAQLSEKPATSIYQLLDADTVVVWGVIVK